MTLDLADLPDDTALLHDVIRGLAGTLTVKDTELEKKDVEIERLQIELARFLRRFYGGNRERWTEGQLSLFEEMVEEALDQAADATDDDAEHEKKKRPRQRNRPRLPEDLPRTEQQHHLDDEECQCPKCGGALTLIGYAQGLQQLEIIPARFEIHDHQLAKYACKSAACTGTVVTTPAPPQAVDRCLAGPGLLAHVIVSKYSDHLPLYRQASMFQRRGIDLSRQTLSGWVASTAHALKPIVAAMRAEVLASAVIHSDDVRVPTLAPGNGKTKSGYLWPYLGDAEHPHVVFEYTPGRHGTWPARFLASYEGYLQADAYSGLDQVYASGKVIEVACWAHARRKFFEIKDKWPEEVATALGLIQQMYAVERAAQQLADAEDRAPPLAEARVALRAQHSRPILDRFADWRDRLMPTVRPASALFKALQYTRNHWRALTRYVEDGRLAIDNNAAERALRRVAVGRKNWLFVGSQAGGRTAAIHYSLVASCALHEIDPGEYYRDVLGKLHTHTPRELMPAAWAAARADV